MINIYLAGRIENNHKNAKEWRNKFIKKISKKNIKIFNPIEREYKNNYKNIVEEDKCDIANSNIVIVYIDKVPSWGTAMEILWAWQLHKAVFIISTQKKLNPWVFYHAHRFYRTIDECVNYINNVYGGN